MKIIIAAAILISIGLVGCVASVYYERPLTSEKPMAERQRDMVECRALAGQTLMGYPHAIDPAALRLTAERQCLRSRGWYAFEPSGVTRLTPSPTWTPIAIPPVAPGCTTCVWVYADGTTASTACQMPFGEAVTGWESDGQCSYQQHGSR